MDDRFETFNYLIFKIAKMIQKIKNIEMEKLGLKAVHVMCIYYLSKHQEGLTSKELTKLTLEDKAAISRALAFLKQQELVCYEAKYNGLILLTSKGLDVASYIEKKSNEALDIASLDISEAEREELYLSLRKIEKNMEEYYHTLIKYDK